MIPQKLIDVGIYWGRAWQLVDGCTKVSEACQNCWAEAMVKRFKKWIEDGYFHAYTMNAGKTVIHGTYNWWGKILLRHDNLDLPLRIKKPTVFSIWNDLFHESTPETFQSNAYISIRACPQHTFLVLTKRPKNAWKFYYRNSFCDVAELCLKNLWLGVTCENQQRADERIPTLLQIPAVYRFVSLEPLLGETSFEVITIGKSRRNCHTYPLLKNLDWLIVGAETGPKARYCPIENIIDVVEQCKAAGVPVFVKAVHLEINKPTPIRPRKPSVVPVKFKISKDMSEWPESIRHRELPFCL